MQSYLLLTESTFFKELSRDSLKALAEICGRKELAKREVLFREGTAGQAMYLLRRGAIQLYKTAPDGSEVVIKVVQPSEVFAEVVLFEQDRYPVSAVALVPGEVVYFLKADLQRLLATPEFRNDFIAMLLRKQRYLAERIVQLASHSVEDRLLGFFKEHYGDEPVIALKLSKKDVAAAIGTTPETLSRLIPQLKKKEGADVGGEDGHTPRAQHPPRGSITQ